jgi:dipeptidyl aminopeptidase/acylaminoacyl peptidase
MMKAQLALILILTIIITIGCARQEENRFPPLSGPYLGQVPPDEEPELFAPGIVSTAMFTRDLSITPDGNEIYFCVSAFGYNLIFYTKQVNGVWTEPEAAPFIRDYQYMFYEPHITPDGKKMLFLSNMPREEGAAENEDIWAVDREGDGWGKPYNPGAPVNSEDEEYFPSVTRDGTIYFTRQSKGDPTGYIYRSRLVNGQYAEAEKLGPEVNIGSNRFNAFVAPDESYIIVPALGMEDSRGSTDYYVIFRDENDNWSRPVNLGDKINTKSGQEYSASVSPDGKYFFFMSSHTNPVLESLSGKLPLKFLKDAYNQPENGNADIYWVDAGFLQKLKPVK